MQAGNGIAWSSAAYVVIFESQALAVRPAAVAVCISITHFAAFVVEAKLLCALRVKYYILVLVASVLALVRGAVATSRAAAASRRAAATSRVGWRFHHQTCMSSVCDSVISAACNRRCCSRDSGEAECTKGGTSNAICSQCRGVA